jgi:SSS family solute:Na+ symporter
MVVGFTTTAFWLLFIKDKEARALGICKALFDKHSLLLEHANWSVVDPIVIALPLSIATAVVVSLLTRPMDKDHVTWCFGGPQPENRAAEHRADNE